MSEEENRWQKMRRCSFLLPDPGGEAVRECVDRIEELEADREIYLLSPKPGDVVVLRTDFLSRHEMGKMAENLKPSFLNNEIVVVQKTESLLVKKPSDD